MTSPSFNLLTAAFIPCLRPDGTQQLLGLRATLLEAGRIVEIRHSSPLVTVAIHRLLLAILHRTFGPADYAAWQALWEARHFPEAGLEAYFGQWQERFDLFHPKYPFFQDISLKDGKLEVASRIIKEQSMTFTDTLANHQIPCRFSGIPFSEAACQLVAEQSFSLSAGQGYVSAHHAYAAVFLVVGASLFETLMLNLTIYNGERPIPARADRPSWEADAFETASRAPRGYIESLTWLARRILLTADGDKIKEIVYTSGPKCEHTGGIADPMLAYRVMSDSGLGPYSFHEEKGLWRDIPVLLSATGVSNPGQVQRPMILTDLAALVVRDIPALSETRQLSLRAYGLLGKNAAIRYWREISLPLPLAFLGSDDLIANLQLALDAAEQGATVLYKAAQRLVSDILAPGEGKPDSARVSVMMRNLGMERDYWGTLERPFRRLVHELSTAGPNAEDLVAAWVQSSVRIQVLRAFDNGVASLDGRARTLRAIARSSQRLRATLAGEFANFRRVVEHEQS